MIFLVFRCFYNHWIIFNELKKGNFCLKYIYVNGQLVVSPVGPGGQGSVGVNSCLHSAVPRGREGNH